VSDRDDVVPISITLTMPVLPDPPNAGTHPPEVYWRCGGEGTVVVSGGLVTPCGACFGQGPAKPCPKCDSRKIKVRYDGHYAMYCRDCGYIGPAALGDLSAYLKWQDHQPSAALDSGLEQLQFP
jgi:hypothetical protein